jgi:hypothetical protein
MLPTRSLFVGPFYERLGGTRLNAVAWRNHDQLQRSGD